MRVIAGEFRSRQLQAPRGMATRPTSDRLRETLFNVLGPRIDGAHFVDLYAGSGAVGIEALSRGAASCVFAEKAGPALAAVRANLAALKIGAGYQVETRGVVQALEAMAKTAAKLGKPQIADIVFLDPPYEAEEEYESTLRTLARLHVQLLDAGSLVVAEHNRKKSLPARVGVLERTRVLEQGDAALSFYRLAAQEPDEPVS
ncbi:MAG: 16S rRNA (guanine(966)-N(2))-methyltransferase RsmD [Acidobacteriaceae bacterium]|nr:16S rRNA (guanine(966)-N(2))-methyltransferase RsmD [Acidobacteriaceae bacterium]